MICFEPEVGTRLVKRVIGVPGDEIEMRQLQLMINGEGVEYGAVDEGALADLNEDLKRRSLFATETIDERAHSVMAQPGVPSSYRNFPKLILGEGEYFVMGDNRDNSKDSRIFGTMPRERIVGEATQVVMSFAKTDLYQPRWGRFFTGLK